MHFLRVGLIAAARSAALRRASIAMPGKHQRVNLAPPIEPARPADRF
jgi:hypothetical protein